MDMSLDILGLSQDQNYEEKSARVATQIVSAVHEHDANYALEQIYKALSESGSASLLDPLKVIPVLLPAQGEAAKKIMALAGDNCSAKEIIIAVQEAMERIRSSFSYESDEDEEENTLSPVDQLCTLVSLYSSSISRLGMRTKTPSETISPLLSELEAAIRLVPSHTVPAEGRNLIGTVSSAIQTILQWAKINAANNSEEVVRCKMVLHSLLETTVTACVRFVNSSLAQKAFSVFFPRLVFRSVVKPGREESDKIMHDATDASSALGYDPSALSSRPSLASLVFLAHNPLALPYSVPWLSSFLPILLTSIQANIALDESLAILYHQLNRATNLPSEVLSPLAEVLPSLASVHPDPSTRFLAFRLLAQLLTFAPSQIRFEILRDLTSKSDFPQMRTAAIGLVKEAVLEVFCLAPSARESNTFGSPRFMKTFSPLLFRPNPPNLFSSDPSVAELQDSSEHFRLAESLALLYILLRRDTENLTGVLDNGEFEMVESSLLEPLRSFLSSIKSTQGYNSEHDEMALAALEMNLERVDSVLRCSTET